ncbi:MAG: hypothetical protein Q8880_04875 [Bacteroidota bacterium]|nr:hypothetical protein [Bacteroidota bacterium]
MAQNRNEILHKIQGCWQGFAMNDKYTILIKNDSISVNENRYKIEKRKMKLQFYDKEYMSIVLVHDSVLEIFPEKKFQTEGKDIFDIEFKKCLKKE